MHQSYKYKPRSESRKQILIAGGTLQMLSVPCITAEKGTDPVPVWKGKLAPPSVFVRYKETVFNAY